MRLSVATSMGTEKWKLGHSPAFGGCLTRPLLPLLLLLLLLLLPQPGTCQASCPTQETPNTLTEPRYGSLPSLDVNSGFMTGIVQSFLGLVQPNPFPKGESMSRQTMGWSVIVSWIRRGQERPRLYLERKKKDNRLIGY